MIFMQSLLSRIFPLMAISGLLLAGWGLLVTPDDMKSNVQVALWGAKATSSLLVDSATANSWHE